SATSNGSRKTPFRLLRTTSTSAALPADVLVVRSSRKGVFLDPFDVAELAGFASPMEFAAFATRGQELTRKLAGLPMPTVAVVEGRCAGAGLDVALACTYRVAVNLPEVRFESMESGRGLIPCWGSTYRLGRLIGGPRAIRTMTSAEPISVERARRWGLVDWVVRANSAAVEVSAFVAGVQDGRVRPRRFRRLVGRALDRVFGVARDLRPTPGAAAPAHRAILDAIVAGQSSEGEALTAERAGITRLAADESARRLLDLSKLAETASGVEPANPVPPLPRRIGLVGGSELGADLAFRLALAGHEIVLQERTADAAEAAGRRIAARLAAAVKRGDVPADAADRVGLAIRPTTDWVGFIQADLVIEAADEDLGVKRNVFAELEQRMRPRTPLVTTATTVSVEAIAAEARRPGRIGGLHFPNPDARRPVAEIVGHPAAEGVVLSGLDRWCRTWGFTPVRTADRPGRLVRHVLTAYLSEGVSLVSEGLPAEQIDRACREFGFARGPLELCDTLGLDRLAEFAAQLQLARGDGFGRNLLFQRMLAYGWVGRDGADGFYRYRRKVRPNHLARMVLWGDIDEDAKAHYIFDPAAAVREGLERIVLRTVNEAADCLPDEPDADPRTVDLALTYGMDWAPARGGPLRYVDDLGPGAVAERLAAFSERFGPRFGPCDEILRRAEAGESFYGTRADEATRVLSWRVAG
ncbi:MAG TPA: 3-hydroxyacyl-CoA dehydrogenase NAD-binding domain-containing protein, partial [Gemmataceae bacterium]|nr:3-hydroxyacyl-CoA dehydrogenase NAD-binding domain-containing protein [Gemmataceae bacterium]